jgi:hypothetical protein
MNNLPITIWTANQPNLKSKLLLILSIIAGIIGVALTCCVPAIINIHPAANIEYPIIILSIQMDLCSLVLLLVLVKTYRWKKVLLASFSIILMGWLLFCGAIYTFQDRIALPQTQLSEGRQFYDHSIFNNMEDISLKTPDSIILKGNFIHNSTKSNAPLIIFFGGNDEPSPPFFLNNYKGWNIAFINYRGYGLSEGTPTQQNLTNDALFIYDTLSKRKDVDSENIVVMGRSLGSGVAVYLAKERPVKGVVLISAFDSLKGVLGDQLPLLPSVLIKYVFKPVELAKSIKTPVLCFFGDQDRFFVPKRSNALIKAWAGESEVRTIEGVNHQNIYLSHYLHDDTVMFLDKILK